MAHPAKTKGVALGLFITGHSVADVVKATCIPKQTASRWKKEAYAKWLQPFAKRMRLNLPRLRPQSRKFNGKWDEKNRHNQ